MYMHICLHIYIYIYVCVCLIELHGYGILSGKHVGTWAESDDEWFGYVWLSHMSHLRCQCWLSWCWPVGQSTSIRRPQALWCRSQSQYWICDHVSRRRRCPRHDRLKCPQCGCDTNPIQAGNGTFMISGRLAHGRIHFAMEQSVIYHHLIAFMYPFTLINYSRFMVICPCPGWTLRTCHIDAKVGARQHAAGVARCFLR